MYESILSILKRGGSATHQNGFVGSRGRGLCPTMSLSTDTIVQYLEPGAYSWHATMMSVAGSSCMFATMDARSWADIVEEEETRMEARTLGLTQAEWKTERTNLLAAWQGRDIRTCLAHLDRMESLRASYAAGLARPQPTAVLRQRSQFDEDFSLWKEMIEEPAKFGEDITEWLELDAKLSQGSGRWRLGAYWSQLQAEEDAKEAALAAPWRKLYTQAATEAALVCEQRWVRRDIARIVGRIRNAVVTIQAAVRGHQTRSRLRIGDCCMCLSHRICPLLTDVGMMCRACGEQGPYVDITGPLDDGWNWFRAEFVDLTRQT